MFIINNQSKSFLPFASIFKKFIVTDVHIFCKGRTRAKILRNVRSSHKTCGIPVNK